MSILTRSELLTLARQQIFNEYIDRAKDLSGWLDESARAWREEGVKIKYPSFPIYPFDGEVEARADLIKDQMDKHLEAVQTAAKVEESIKLEESLKSYDSLSIAPIEPLPIEFPEIEEVQITDDVPEIYAEELQETKSDTGESSIPVYYKRSKKRWSK